MEYTINHTDSATGSISTIPLYLGTGDTVDLKYTMVSNDCPVCYNKWEIDNSLTHYIIPYVIGDVCANSLTNYAIPYVTGNASTTSLTMDHRDYSPYLFGSGTGWTLPLNAFSGGATDGGTTDYTLEGEGTDLRPNIYLAMNNYVYWPPQDPKAVARQALRAKLAPNIRTRACLKSFSDGPDRTALESLREIISELEFRKYLRYGFILAKGDSGDTYQVFRNNSHVKVWRGGKLIEEICVRIKDTEIPDTDRCIAFKVAIESDEESFKKMGNRYKMLRMAA